jgi:hypothetical protein
LGVDSCALWGEEGFGVQVERQNEFEAARVLVAEARVQRRSRSGMSALRRRSERRRRNQNLMILLSLVGIAALAMVLGRVLTG